MGLQDVPEPRQPHRGSGPLRVLDIGCGPAAFYMRYHDRGALTYVGIEPNVKYVDDARRRFPDIELHAGTVAEVRDRVTGPLDLVVLEGVLHHIDDAKAREALAFAAGLMEPGGRVVALDPVLLPRPHAWADVDAQAGMMRPCRPSGRRWREGEARG